MGGLNQIEFEHAARVLHEASRRLTMENLDEITFEHAARVLYEAFPRDDAVKGR